MFDPSYFIDFAFEEKDPVKLVGAPPGCEVKFQRPNDGTANAAKIGEDNFMNGDNSNYGAMFANKIAVIDEAALAAAILILIVLLPALVLIPNPPVPLKAM